MQDNETAANAASGEETTAQTTESNNVTETAENTVPQTENTDESNSATAIGGDETPETPIENGLASENASPEGNVAETPAEPEEEEEITYHAVQKEDSVTAIWEMQGRKHLRTIDPRSREGAEILRLFTAEEGEEAA